MTFEPEEPGDLLIIHSAGIIFMKTIQRTKQENYPTAAHSRDLTVHRAVSIQRSWKSLRTADTAITS